MDLIPEGNILLVWDRMGDYHRARVKAFELINGKYSVFTSDLGNADDLYLWKSNPSQNRHFVLSDKPAYKFDLFNRILNFRKILKKYKIKNLAIAGYGRAEYIIFIVLAKLFSVQIIIFAESWYSNSWWKDFIKSIFLKLFCDGLLISGKRAHDYFTGNLCINPKKIRAGYSVVDNEHFACNNIKKFDMVPVLLCIARFSVEKNLELLIGAFKKSKINKIYQLKLIGEGPLRNRLAELSKENTNIEIRSWVNYDDLPFQYHQATLFILPSKFEPWGLVINEAMAAGLPVIASKQCGCVPDLVDETNGFVFDAESETSLISCLDYVSQISYNELYKLGGISKQKIAKFTPETWAQNLIELISQNENN